MIHGITAAKESGQKRIVKCRIRFSSSDIIVKLEKRISYYFKSLNEKREIAIGQSLRRA